MNNISTRNIYIFINNNLKKKYKNFYVKIVKYKSILSNTSRK